MQQIITFLLRNKHSLFFILLISIGFGLTIQSHSYHKSKFIHAANAITGGVYESASNFSEYLNLKDYNARLLEENAKLRAKISNTDLYSTEQYSIPTPYTLIPAKVIQNSVRSKKNILVINRGRKHGLAEDMGVITSNGIVGIIESVGNNYATVLSILHTQSKLNAQIKKNNHIGSLFWDGEKTNIVQLADVSKVANVKVNDTVVTGNYSTFPQGIGIGTISYARLNQSKNYYDINIQLFNDMGNVGYVYVIKNKAKEEINQLLNPENE